MNFGALLKTVVTLGVCVSVSTWAQWEPTTLGSLVAHERYVNRETACEKGMADGSVATVMALPVYACTDLGGKTPAAYQLELCKDSMNRRREDSILPNACLSPVNGFTVPNPMPASAVYSSAGLKAWAGCKAAILAMNERSQWPMEQCSALVNWKQIESGRQMHAQGYGGATDMPCDDKHVCS